MKLKFRAFMFCGFVHGGGSSMFGDWRDSYEEAAKDLEQECFKSGYGDSATGVETVPAEKAP